MHPRPPVALSIAGSDPSGGAGVQADLKTFSALGAYGTGVITALTAQATTGVTGVHAVPPEFVALQIDTLVADVRIDAVKIGMLSSAALAETVAAYLRPGGALAGRYVVLDPVMVSTSGSRLLDDDAVDAVRAMLPYADAVTPNLAEAAVLTGRPLAATTAEMRDQLAALRDLGVRGVLLKGGHLADTTAAVDLWLDDQGERTFAVPRIDTANTHGTGCTLSSALAALRPRQPDWPSTIFEAKAWLTAALSAADALEIGSGPGPVHHFHEMLSRWS